MVDDDDRAAAPEDEVHDAEGGRQVRAEVEDERLLHGEDLGVARGHLDGEADGVLQVGRVVLEAAVDEAREPGEAGVFPAARPR